MVAFTGSAARGLSAHDATPRASVIVVATNERHHLVDLLPSLSRQTYPNYEVIVVDNGSTDGGPEYVESTFPHFRVVRNGANLGYIGANNRGFDVAAGDVLVVLNPDTEVEPAWLTELVAALGRHPEAGLTTSQIVMFYERGEINTCGNDVHVSGLTFCRGLGAPRSLYQQECRVAAVSGCSFAVRRDVLARIGRFDDRLNPYLEDTDLSWRANVAGYRLIYAPASVVYHKYALRMRPQKFSYLEENRLVVLVKSLHWSTLLLLSPSLVLVELMTWTFAARGGRAYLAAKLGSYVRLVREFPSVLQRRRAVQGQRRVRDSELVGLLSWRLPLKQTVEVTAGVRAAGLLCDALFWLNWQVARALVR